MRNELGERNYFVFVFVHQAQQLQYSLRLLAERKQLRNRKYPVRVLVQPPEQRGESLSSF